MISSAASSPSPTTTARTVVRARSRRNGLWCETRSNAARRASQLPAIQASQTSSTDTSNSGSAAAMR
jgi:hypothetical protein